MGPGAPPAVSEHLADRQPTRHCSVFSAGPAGPAVLVAAGLRPGSTWGGTSCPALVPPGSIHQRRGPSVVARGAGHARHTDSVGHTDGVGHTRGGHTGGTRGSGARVTGQPVEERHKEGLKKLDWAASSAGSAPASHIHLLLTFSTSFPGPSLRRLHLCDPVAS